MSFFLLSFNIDEIKYSHKIRTEHNLTNGNDYQ